MVDEWSRIPKKTAAEVCALYKPTPAARARLEPSTTPRGFVEALVAGDMARDAVAFMTQALPKRESIYWAYLCVDSNPEAAASETCRAALDVARDWVAEPSDNAKRREAMTLAKAAGLDTPAGCVAAAVFFCGDSIAPADLPAVVPAPHVAGTMAAAAIQLAAVNPEPSRAGERLQNYLALAGDLAAGKIEWPKKR